jgi:hypothetical protein
MRLAMDERAVRCLLLIGGLSVIVFTGCGTWVTDTQLNPAPRPLVPRGYDSVEVFSSAAPARPHVDVALLKVDQTNAMDDHLGEVMIQRLRERAGAMGCDAVFIGATQERAAPDLFNSGSRTMSATCIVYRQPGDHGLVPPSPPAPRMCVDRRDFNDHRNCILPAPGH